MNVSCSGIFSFLYFLLAMIAIVSEVYGVPGNNTIKLVNLLEGAKGDSKDRLGLRKNEHLVDFLLSD